VYGSRARLGLVVPSSNTTAEPEIGRLLPAGVDAYAGRVMQEETDDPARKAATVLAMRAGLGRAVDELASVLPAAIGFACTAASFLNGAADDRETCSVLSARARCPVLTTSRAVVLALAALGVRRVALATPYLDSINRREADFLAEEGVTVVRSVGLGIVGNLPKGRLPVGAARDVALQADTPSADAVFLSCTNWRTAECLGELETRLGKPVFSSNAATAWALLRAAGVREDLPALGRLGSLPTPSRPGPRSTAPAGAGMPRAGGRA
jgi:maleate cis-trans isomerase